MLVLGRVCFFSTHSDFLQKIYVGLNAKMMSPTRIFNIITRVWGWQNVGFAHGFLVMMAAVGLASEPKTPLPWNIGIGFCQSKHQRMCIHIFIRQATQNCLVFLVFVFWVIVLFSTMAFITITPSCRIFSNHPTSKSKVRLGIIVPGTRKPTIVY